MKRRFTLFASVALALATTAAAQGPAETRRVERLERESAPAPAVASAPQIVWRRVQPLGTHTLLFSADGTRLVAHQGIDSARVFDAADGALLREIEFSAPRGSRAVTLSVANALAVSAGTYVDLYNLGAAERLDRIACATCNRNLWTLAFSPDGSRLALQDRPRRPSRCARPVAST